MTAAKASVKWKITGLLLTLALMIGAFGMLPITASAADDALCTSTNNCTGTYSNGFCSVCDGYEMPAGEGSDAIPYEIANAGQLYWFADKVTNDNENYGAVNAVLTADITVNENVLAEDGSLNTGDFRPWNTTIGSSYFDKSSMRNVLIPYTGTFDGDSHSISGLYFNDSENGSLIALFGCIGEGGKASDLTLTDTHLSGYSGVAGFAAYNYGTVEGCTVEGVIRVSDCAAGGIVVENHGTVENCHNKATVGGAENTDWFGGIAVENYGTIEGCHNSAAIGGAMLSQIGGIARLNDAGGVIRNSHNSGTLTGKNMIGGIVSHNQNSSDDMPCGLIENCYNTGAINANREFAGIADFNRGEIRNCFSTGKINDGESSIACYNNDPDSKIANSYYLGTADDGFDGSSAVTAEQLASGEVAYKLNGSTSAGTLAWGQTLGTDSYPVFAAEGNTVYEVVNCKGVTVYANEDLADGAHIYGEDGFCTVCDGYEMPVSDGWGRGYDIYNAGQLYWYADHINNGGTMYARLMTDIMVNPDLTAENPRVWTPIGTYETPFGGLFDGLGHTVSGLYLNDPTADYVGLFGVISDTANIVGVTVTDSSFTGRNFVGGVAAYNKGRVRGVGAYDVTIDANSYGGLLVGYNGGETTDSFANGRADAAIGYNVGTVANVYALEGITPIGGGAQKGATSVRESTFASGELAYLLHENETSICYWGQNLGADAYPRTSANDAEVYRYIKNGVLCTGDIYGYANVETPDGTLVHDENATSYENGFCTVCGGYEPATKNADGAYEIANAGQLYWFANKVNSDQANFGAANAVLTADIVINENVLIDGALNPDADVVAKFRPWETTIGYTEHDAATNTYFGPAYTGTFDGDGHSISGLYFNNDSENGQYIALFGHIGKDGKVCDLTLKDTYFSGRDSVAGLAVYNYGTVEGCTVEGVIRVGQSMAGGIVVQNYGTVKNSHNKAAVRGAENAYFLGGIAARNHGTIDGCHNSAEIGGAMLSQIGGIAQLNEEGGVIRNSYNSGTLTGENMIGGIVCHNQSSYDNKPCGVIENCCNTGDINANWEFAGIADTNWGVIRNCFSIGEIYDGESSIARINDNDDSKIENSYYLGTADDGFEGSSAVTDEQLENGEVAYLLQGEQTEAVWGQTIGEDEIPTLGGETVYKNTACENGTVTYSNDASQTATGKHTLDENGFCTVCGGFEEATLNNNGTPDDAADDYYEIANAGQLYWFADKVNGDHANFSAANAVLTADITVNENVLATVGAADFDPTTTALKQWIPIGKANFSYNGIFDGAGHSISGLYVYDTSNYAEIGFIGFLGNGTVKDLTISDSSFTGGYGSFVGAIVGYMLSSTVEGCFSNAAVSGYYAGGIVGYQNDNDIIRNCGFIGSVYGTDAAGGIIGGAGYFRHLENCFVSGAVSGESTVGGIVGVSVLPVTNCYYNSELFTEPDHFHGGIGMTTAQFASGEVAYNLGAAFGQTIGTDAIPVFADEDNTVYRYYLVDCLCSAPAAYGYTNNAEQKGGTFVHDTNIKYVNGFCPICDAYEAASVVTTDNWASLGLSPSNYEKYLGYHAITNAGQLYWFISNEDAYDAAKGMKAVLTRDIVINEGLLDISYNLTEGSHREWKPIDGVFAVVLDGNGHTVSGLYIDQPEKNDVALISKTASSAVIRDLGIVDSYICGKYYVGAIVGVNYGTVENCYNEGRVYGESYISGLVAVNGGTVKNSYNLGLVDDWNIPQSAAGIVGYNQATATVEDCYNYSVMSNVGSGIAYVNEGKIINCYYMEGALPSVNQVGGTSDEHAMMNHQFANGEVAFRLGAPFGQNINTQPYPVIGGLKVYASVSCNDGSVLETSNDYRPEFESGDHKFGENGLCTVCGAYRPATLNDDGVYEIGNIGQLYWFADKVNSDHANFGAANAVLTADITVNENVLATVGASNFDPATTALKPWTPIGNTDSTPYSGTFDGDGHSISGLYFNNDSENGRRIALFGYIGEDGKVCDLTLKDTYFSGYNYIAGVAANNYGTVEGCTVEGTIRIKRHSGGGIVGNNYGTIENCHNKATVTSEESAYFLGGIAAESHGTIRGCYNSAEIGGENCWQLGGIAYFNGAGGVICNSHNTGALTGMNSIGGIVYSNGKPDNADSSGGVIENCCNTGDITGDNLSGGIVQENGGEIRNCLSTGEINGGESNIVFKNIDGTTQNSYYLGTVNDVHGGTTAVTDEQLESGEVAYLLNGSTSEGTLAWGQTLDGEEKDSHPVLGGAKVYQTTNCAQAIGYSNIPSTSEGHVYVNGFCTLCGGYEPATQNADGAYVIDNAGKLYWFADKVSNDNANFGAENAVLTADIVINENVLVDGALNPDADAVAKFRPWETTIGYIEYDYYTDTYVGPAYTGTFDGDGHSISGLYFNDSSEKGQLIALFGYIGEDGKVCDLTLKDTYFSGAFVVAGLAAFNYGTVEGCTVEGVIRVSASNAGGIVVNNYGTVKNSRNKAAVRGAENAYFLGGIAVENYGTIDGCHNSAEIGGAMLYQFGGIAQSNNAGGVIRNSHNSGTLTGENMIGGIVCYNQSSYDNKSCGLIENCCNTGDINADREFAGIAYTNRGEIRNCLSTDKLNGGESSIAYDNSNADSKIENSYYLGTADDSLGGTDYVTDEQLASGEVAYKLNGSTSEGTLAWGQTIGEDEIPTLGGKKVYKNTVGCNITEGTVKYSNTEATTSDHKFVNGFCVLCDGFEAPTLNNNGTSDDATDDYYEIDNAGKLYWFANKVNSDNATFGAANAKLTADIVINENVLIDGALNPDADAVAKFRPWDTTIGYSFYGSRPEDIVEYPYTGTFDGDGHSISGLYFNDSENGRRIALFGLIGEDGKVSDLTLKDTCFSGYIAVAGLAAHNVGTVEGCTVEGVIRVSLCSAGGIVVQNYGTVKNSRNKATVTSEESAYFLGGIAADNYGTIDGCHNSAEIGGAGLTQIGGISQSNNAGGVIRNSYNTGTLTGSSAIGGIVYFNKSSSGNKPCGVIENCYNTGAINANQNFAGIADTNGGMIRNCFSTGKLNDGESSIARTNSNANSKIENSYYLGMGDNDGFEGTFALTAEQFASGEAAHRLQSAIAADEDGEIAQVWGQTIGEDAHPTLGGDEVYIYHTGKCSAPEPKFANVETESTVVHDDLADIHYIEDENGDMICIVCLKKAVFAANVDYGSQIFYFTTPAGVTAWVNDRDMGVTTVTLLSDITEDVQFDRNVTVELGGNTLSGRLIVGEGGSVTLRNGVVEADIWNRNELILGENVRVTGDIKECGNLYIASPLMTTIDVAGEGTIRGYNNYHLTTTDLESIRIALAEGEAKVLIDPEGIGEIRFGKLEITLSRDEFFYVRDTQAIPDVTVSIGGYVLGSGSYAVEWPTDMIYPGIKTVKVTLPDTVITESGEREFELTYEIKKVIPVAGITTVALPYGADLTEGVVRGAVRHSAENLVHVGGSWSAVTLGSDGKYYATFMPSGIDGGRDYGDLYEAITVEITDDMRDETQVVLEEVTVHGPAWVVLGENMTFSVTAKNPENGETFPIPKEHVQYFYKIGEDGNWIACATHGEDTFSLNVSAGDKVYIKAEIAPVDKKWIPATSAEITLDARQNSELLSELKEALDALSGFDVDTIAEMAEKIAALETAIETLKQDTAAADAEIKTLIEQAEARLNESIEKLENRVKTLEDALANVDLAQIALNKTNIAAISELVEALEAFHDLTNAESGLSVALADVLNRANAALTAQVEPLAQRVAALESKVGDVNVVALKETVDAIKALTDGMPAVAELDKALENISDILQRLAAAEQKIAALETAVEALKQLTAEGGDIAKINEALKTVEQKLAALESADLNDKTRLDAAEAAIRELNTAIETVNGKLGQIETNKTDISTLNSSVVSLKDSLTTLAGRIPALEIGINELKMNLNALGDKIATIEEELVKINNTITRLEKNLAELSTLIFGDETALDQLTEALSKVNTALAELEALNVATRLGAAESAITELGNQIAAINTTLANANLDQIGANATAIGTLKTTVDSIQSTLSALGQKDAELASAIEAAKGELNTLIGGIDTRLKTAEEKIAALEIAVEALAKLTAEGGDIAKINAALAEIKSALAALDAKDLSTDERIDDVKASILTLDAAIKKINEETVTAIKGDITTNTADITALKSTVTAIQGTLSRLESEDASLKASIGTLTTDLGKLSGELETVKQDIEAIKAAIDLLKREIEDLSKIATGDASTIERLEKALDDVDAALERLEGLEDNTRLTAVEEALKTLETTVTAINGKLSGIETNAAAITALDSTVKALQGTLTSLAKAHDELGGTVGTLQITLGELTDRVAALEGRVNTAEQKIATLEESVIKLNLLLDNGAAITRINEALAEVQQNLKAIEGLDLSTRFSKLDDAITLLNAAVNKINEEALVEIEKNVSANFATLVSLDLTVEGIQTTLAKLEANGESYAASIDLLNKDLRALSDKLDLIEKRLSDAEQVIDTINAAIATLKQTDEMTASMLAEAIAALSKSVEDAKALAAAGDVELQATLQNKIDAAKRSMNAAISSLESHLNSEIASLKAGNHDLADKIAALGVTVDALRTALEAADAENKATLEAMILASETTLDAAIEQVQTNLDNAKAALEESIKNGDDHLSSRLDELNEALDVAEKVLKEADEALKSELTDKIESADAALEAIIKQLQSDLEQAREAAESGDKALNDRLNELSAAMAENEKSAATTDTTLAVVSSTAVVGNLAMGAWLVLSKFRRR